MNRIAAWMSIAAVGVAVGVACGPRTKEPVEQLEHRLAACTQTCEARYASSCDFEGMCEVDCGLYPKGELLTPFASTEECVESCADPVGDAAHGWGYVGDGEDACGPEFEAHARCLAELSCADRFRYYTDVPKRASAADFPCGVLTYAMLDCQSAHPYDDQQDE